MDTTLRDGEQTQGVSFSSTEKISIAKALLHSLRVDRIEVATVGVSEGEKQAVTSINKWAYEEGFSNRVEILGFVDYKRSVDWIVETGGKVINLLTKGSEKHCLEQLRKPLSQHIDDILKTVDYALTQKLQINVYLEDWSNGYQDNKDYVFTLMRCLENSGISHFMLPDTLGIMCPEQVFTSLSDMRCRYPYLQFDFHPHNDYGLATANTVAAVRAGINSIHCTMNCLGERAGNASLAQVAVVLRDKMNMNLAIDESHLVRVSHLVENFSGKRISANEPIIGADVFTQTAGIHADGDQKAGLYKSKLAPKRFLRTHSYALGKMSGKASLKKNLELLEVELSAKNQEKVLARIVKLGDSKQTINVDDLPFIIADVLENKDYQHIKLLNCVITSGLNLEAMVSMRVEVKGITHTASGSGNGGFDAFIDAINKVMKLHNHTLPDLIDYEIRIPKGGGHANALTECIITWNLNNKIRRTRGVHSNQVFAAVSAALRIINIQIHEA